MYIDNLSLAELGVSTNNKSGLQSGLILRVQTAINKKIEDLTFSDLRLLISQCKPPLN
jgi:hypothetical protein